MNRALVDAQFISTEYLPAAASTSYTDVFDLEAVEGNPGVDKFDISCLIAAAANNTDSTKYITATLHDSANNSAFTEVAPRIQCRVPGVTSSGSVATTFTFRLPPGIRRYVKLLLEVPDTGDNTAVLVTTKLLF